MYIKLSEYDKKIRAIKRFHKKYTVVEGEHWIWKGTTNRYGYGVASYKGKKIGAHRLSALLFIDENIPSYGRTRYVCHHCDIPGCVNPKHLYVGTPSENQQDTLKRGRRNVREPLTWYTKYKTR